MRRHFKQYSLAYVIGILFLLCWIGQLFTEAATYIDEARDHGHHVASVWVAMGESDFWEQFGQSTFENWQSEWLQVATFVIATAYLIYKGSAESADSEERIEAKLDALLEERGIFPGDVEKTRVAEKHRR
jgi:hypothetical protein